MQSTATLDSFTATEFLVDGYENCPKTILLTGVSWHEYERFLADFEEKAGWHLAYNDGNLEIMPPLAEHEKPARTIDRLTYAYSDYFDLIMEALGSTTYRRELKLKGVEPDSCYYVQSASKIIGKIEDLKPESYPVPDVAVEIDVTHGSLDKFPIYAALQVGELWIYDGAEMRFFQLAGEKYNQTQTSRAFPRLSANVLTGFLAESRTDGQSAALKSFRKWLESQK